MRFVAEIHFDAEGIDDAFAVLAAHFSALRDDEDDVNTDAKILYADIHPIPGTDASPLGSAT